MSGLLLPDTAAHRGRVRGPRAGRRVVVPLAEYRAVRAGHPVAFRRALPAAEPGVTGDDAACDLEVRQVPGEPGEPDVPAEAGAPGLGEPPLRLTRRGRVVVRLLAGAALLLVVAAGVLADRPALAGPEPATVPVAERVVLPGETLWAIAGEVAPGTDRRETVAQIMELNGLRSAEVRAGQRLAVPARTR
jgi:hypothetical protein